MVELTISPREQEILRLRALGFTADQVAARLDVSRHTVNQHSLSTYRKLKVTCLADAFRAMGWLRVPE